jgi:hypothetical protein
MVALMSLYLLAVGCSSDQSNQNTNPVLPGNQKPDSVLPVHNAEMVTSLVLVEPINTSPAAVHPGESLTVSYRLLVNNKTTPVSRKISVLTGTGTLIAFNSLPDAAPHDLIPFPPSPNPLQWMYTENADVTIPDGTVEGYYDVELWALQPIPANAIPRTFKNRNAVHVLPPELPADTTAPLVNITVGPNDGANGWWVGKPTVTFTVDDTGTGNSNIDNINCWDNGSPAAFTITSGEGTPYVTGTIDVSDEGINNVSVDATDSAGNTGTGDTVEVKIDTIKPEVTIDVPDPSGNNGWFKTSPVSVDVNATDYAPGSGIDSDPTGTYSISDEGINHISYSATDMAGNEGTGSADVPIDTVAPAITIAAPNGGYECNESVAANYYATDATSGVASCTGTVDNGSYLDTTIPGPYTFTVDAGDYAGNTSSVDKTWYVQAEWSGFLPPVTNWPKAPGLFKLGSTIPFKCQIFDCNGVSVGDTMGLDAILDIKFVKYINNEPAGDPMEPEATGNTGLRYEGDKYIFNWSTKGLEKGYYEFQLLLYDGTTRSVVISLK